MSDDFVLYVIELDFGKTALVIHGDPDCWDRLWANRFLIKSPAARALRELSEQPTPTVHVTGEHASWLRTLARIQKQKLRDRGYDVLDLRADDTRRSGLMEAKQVRVGDKYFPSLRSAARRLGISPTGLAKRIASGKYDCSYVD